MLESLLAVTWVAYGVIATLCVLFIALVANERYGWATFGLLSIGAICFFFVPTVVAFFLDPWKILWYGILYVGGGLIHAYAQWIYLIRDQKKDYLHACEKLKTAPPKENYIPVASRYTGDIVAWMAWWPFSGAWFIINRPIRSMYHILADAFGGIFNWTSRKVFEL